MTTDPSKPDLAADLTQDPAGSPDPSPGKTYTEEQYQRAMNRKLANYVPKTEYQAALDRAASLEASIGTLQTDLQGLKTKLSSYEIGDLKAKIGKEAGLPSDWIEELKGTDEASLKAHAEALRKKLGIKQNTGNPVPPALPGQPKTENEAMNGMLLGMARGGFTGR